MKTLIFILMSIGGGLWFLSTLRRKPSLRYNCIDVIIPAYNEGPCLALTLENLLLNPYFNKVICVNDGSTDDTEVVMMQVKEKWGERLVVVSQKNTGKGGALMHGLSYATCEQVFLSDADTYVPPDSLGMGYMLAEIERGADAVGGIPSTLLKGAGLLPHIRATVKLPMIVMKRTLQQILGGAPFIISGACGMFRTDVLRKFGFSDRTKVEDLDLTWTLVANGYRVRQVNRCIVYPQECNTLKDEWKRWRRWIVGYAVCMRLHKSLLLSRFGIFSIFPMILVVLYGISIYLTAWINQVLQNEPLGIILSIFPLIWVGIVCSIGAFSAWYHRSWKLIPLAPLSILYVLLSYSVWMIHGIIAFFTGKEPTRDKPTRYSALVDSSATYSFAVANNTEDFSQTHPTRK
ncbi:glycosyltransferase family 2 protein [Escherichia coli]|uniref:glycosyltransferase n=1 Tax=Escherichia coli TaxID=562 RepID=UPI000B50A13D|nr:glycosyltransferase family 2 protein [Escherichia coli]EFG7323261.1 glycosyltransferase family 2 protein [Escherichia coli]EFH6315607.1 glycosyltransferase [Escherichia coli]EFM3459583.1 glycosyltransferase family 2 protein [Escherichia coli]EGD6299276.1 glycosyltransferase family 2 protein [Escherichia coli]EGM7559483.1 glycosyltransferase family 2 protein [Escherichia coli]